MSDNTSATERTIISQTYRVDAWGVTHTGMVREMNEDRYCLHTQEGVWAVADGMGGHEGGAYVSGRVVDNLSSIGVATGAADLRARVSDRLHRANDEVYQMAQERNVTVGSTVVSLLVHGDHYACLWCGDSRLYLIRDGAIEQVSTDHSEVQQLLADGTITPEEAANWPRKNVITRAIGVAADPGIDLVTGHVRKDDVFVLCSDGLTEHLSDAEILERTYGRRSQTACEDLLQTTLERGARDNTTVVVVRCIEAETTFPINWSA